AEAFLKGRIIKSRKDIEIYVPLENLDSRILGYADIYIPEITDYNLKFVMKRLAEKLINRFPLVKGKVIMSKNKLLCVEAPEWIASDNKISLDWPAFIYLNTTHDPIRGSDQEIISISQIMRSQPGRFFVKSNKWLKRPYNQFSVIIK
ncbi:hypothetical protein MHK_007303, partial [Candidatus Magnetomorum sp. HK-1]